MAQFEAADMLALMPLNYKLNCTYETNKLSLYSRVVMFAMNWY